MFNKTINFTLINNKNGFEYIESNMGLTLPFIVLSGLGIIFGLGNFLVVASVLFIKDLRTPTNLIILNLAISDILQSIFIGTFSILGFIFFLT